MYFRYNETLQIFVLTLDCARALRAGLLKVENTRQAPVDKNEKVEMLYHYLYETAVQAVHRGHRRSVPRFEARPGNRKVSTRKRRAKKDKMFERAIGGVSGMYGDLQGIFGMTMPELDGVEMKSLVPSLSEDPEGP